MNTPQSSSGQPSGPPMCRACAAPLQHTFVDLGMSPLCESYLLPDQLDQMEPFYPLHARVCHRCHLVQLPAYVDPVDVFTEYAYFASFSDTWVRHAWTYTESASERFGLDDSSFVVEVGSNDGYLLKHFVARGVPVLGVEPAANVAEAARGEGVPTLTAFFGRATAHRVLEEWRPADLVVANNVLAQVPDLNDFVAGLQLVLGRRGVLTVEFPHLLKLIDGLQFDTIYHEHYSYFSFTAAEQIFARHGLTIFDVAELPTHGGSLRLYVRKVDDLSKPVEPSVATLRAVEESRGLTSPAAYASFQERVAEAKRSLLTCLIGAKQAGKSIVGYGAPGKGNTLLNYCGIRTDLLDYTVDKNPYKQGRFLPGTHIPILDPAQLRVTQPDYVLVLPWNIKEEIFAQLAYIRTWGGRFIVPVPEVREYA